MERKGEMVSEAVRGILINKEMRRDNNSCRNLPALPEVRGSGGAEGSRREAKEGSNEPVRQCCSTKPLSGTALPVKVLTGLSRADGGGNEIWEPFVFHCGRESSVGEEKEEHWKASQEVECSR